MKIYLAGERAAMATTAAIRRLGGEAAAAVWTQKVKRRLFSFYYHGFSKTNYEEDPKSGLSAAIADSVEFGWDLFLDSGAFTAFTQNKEIPITEYAEYIKKWQHVWTTCSSLDAIGRGAVDSMEQRQFARQSWSYYKKLTELGAKVQPVYHVREPFEVMHAYLNLGADYIFIGGMVPESTQWLMQRLDMLWDKVLTNPDGTPKVKVHGFGLTDQRLMFRYPWYSVDSSSWLMTGVFGSCVFREFNDFRDRNELKKITFSLEASSADNIKAPHFHNMSEIGKEEVRSWLEPYGVTVEQVTSHYSFRDVVNAAVFQSLEDIGTDKFINNQPVIWDIAV